MSVFAQYAREASPRRGDRALPAEGGTRRHMNLDLIHAPGGGVMIVGALNHERYGGTIADGTYAEVEVADGTTEIARAAVQRVVAAAAVQPVGGIVADDPVGGGVAGAVDRFAAGENEILDMAAEREVDRLRVQQAEPAALAGGGVKGGLVIGKTDKSGESVTDRQVTVNDTLARSAGVATHALKFSKLGAAFMAELAKGTVPGLPVDTTPPTVARSCCPDPFAPP